MTSTQLSAYHCPRWEELPALGLYLDQVMLVLEEALGPITPGPDKVVITPTIINNYVKQKVLAPTQKKKYGRDHLADLVMIALLKRALSTVEIVRVLQVLKQGRQPQEAYDAFCCELECRLNEQPGGPPPPPSNCPPLVQAAVKALAGKILFELLLDNALRRQAALAPPPEKKRSKAEKAEKADKNADKSGDPA